MTDASSARPAAWWQAVLFAAIAGGMAWGIRGQYGHETGAMMAGLLVSLVLTFLLCPTLPGLTWARTVALATVAMGFGGTMTYGQTVGLTHDPGLVGNWDALRWGFLGLAVKGSVWIGFAGVFFGMGLGGKRYGAGEMLMLALAMLGAYYLGTRTLNYPFNPAERQLPYLYFSADWHWWPDVADLKPRREAWGGLWFALVTVLLYAWLGKKDALARNMGLWGILGGALGFPLGQSVQADHAWRPEIFETGLWTHLGPYMNWWNMMEITFGTTMGAVLGLGLWLNRKRISAPIEGERVSMPIPVEVVLIVVHFTLLFFVEFRSVAQVDALYDLGLVMGILPLVGIVSGRIWPYATMTIVFFLPIAGKTLMELGYENETVALPIARTIYFLVPMAISLCLCVWLMIRARGETVGRRTIGVALMVSAWLLFLLNYAFFRFPWPWADWTGRTPSGIIYTVCIAALTGLVAFSARGRGVEKVA